MKKQLMNLFSRTLPMLLLASTIAFTTSCSDSDNTPEPEDNNPSQVEDVVITVSNIDDLKELSVGSTVKINAQSTDNDNDFDYSLDNSDIIEVDSDGTISAKASGTTNITINNTSASLTVTAIVSSSSTLTNNKDEQGISYELYTTYATVSGGSDNSINHKVAGELTIPAFVIRDDTKYPVTKIEESAFEGNTNITGLAFADGSNIESIDKNAFKGCTNIEGDINLSKCTDLSLIEQSAFYKCAKITSINLKGCNKLEVLGVQTASNCSLLESVDFSDCSALRAIQSSSFYRCSNLKAVTLQNNDALSAIGNRAFASCDTELNIAINQEGKTWYVYELSGSNYTYEGTTTTSINSENWSMAFNSSDEADTASNDDVWN